MFLPLLKGSSCRPSRFGGFLRDRKASIAVEFGLIWLPFIALFGATVDVALLYYMDTQLQIVTDNVSRMLRVNSVARFPDNQDWSQLYYNQFIETYVCTWQKNNGVVAPGTLGKMFDCSKLVMLVQSLGQWSRAYMDDDFRIPPQTGRMRLPTGGGIGVVRIGYPIDSYFGFIGRSNSRVTTSEDPDGTRGIRRSNALVGVAAFRVEPGSPLQ